MTEILKIREKVRCFLQDYETWFQIIAKFIGMYFVFTYVNSALGYFAMLNNVMVNVLLSLICSIIPGAFSVFIVAAVIIAHMVKLSVILAVFVLVVMLIAYLLFLKFAPEQSFVLLAVPVLMQYDLHYMIPILAGMFFTPYAVAPAFIGFFMVKFIGYTCEASSLTGTGTTINLDGIVSALTEIYGKVVADTDLWLFMIIAAVTITIVFVIGKLSFDYSWYVAILAGIVAEIASAFLCAASLEASTGLMSVIIGTVISGVAAVIIQFFKCPLNYLRKEHLQFEDDDYYYYVKAIPKLRGPEPVATEPVHRTERRERRERKENKENKV